MKTLHRHYGLTPRAVHILNATPRIGPKRRTGRVLSLLCAMAAGALLAAIGSLGQ